MSDTQIKTGWDLKQALEKIIATLDAGGKLFAEIDKEEGVAIDWFAKALEKRRAEAVTALKDHHEAMVRDVHPLLDKIDATRMKVEQINPREIAATFGEIRHLREIAELAETMERLSRISEEGWATLGRLATLTREGGR